LHEPAPFRAISGHFGLFWKIIIDKTFYPVIICLIFGFSIKKWKKISARTFSIQAVGKNTAKSSEVSCFAPACFSSKVAKKRL